MREGYSVTVSKWSEPILTIEHRCLSGAPQFSTEDEEAIRIASEHLLAFIGDGTPQPCFLCKGVESCSDDCEMNLLYRIEGERL